jgi:hypothetical protein
MVAAKKTSLDFPQNIFWKAVVTSVADGQGFQRSGWAQCWLLNQSGRVL